MAARGNIFPICPQLGDGRNHKKYQETLNLSKRILKTKMVPQSGDLLKRSFKNGGDLSGQMRRHRHCCVFKTYNEAELWLPCKNHLKCKEAFVLSLLSLKAPDSNAPPDVSEAPKCFLLLVLVSKQLELQFRSLELSFMSKSFMSP